MTLALAVTPLLSACSGRDTTVAEKAAAAQDAAFRAEKAAERAEKAAAKVDKGQPVVMDAEPEPDLDPQDKAVADQNEPANPDANSG